MKLYGFFWDVSFTNRTTGHLQYKQDLIYLTDYLYIYTEPTARIYKEANGRRYIIKNHITSFYHFITKN
jgi:hypothetical protein